MGFGRNFVVVVDTNLLFSDQEKAPSIQLAPPAFQEQWKRIAAPGDVKLLIPDVVIRELTYQKSYLLRSMLTDARGKLAKVRDAMQFDLAIPDDVSIDMIRSAVSEKLIEQVATLPNCAVFALRSSRITGERAKKIIDAALWRDPPFEHGAKEKGFRDALILETFYAIVEVNPHSDVALITKDHRVREAALLELRAAHFGSYASLQDFETFVNVARSAFTPEFLHEATGEATKRFSGSDDALWESGLRESAFERFNLSEGKSAVVTTEPTRQATQHIDTQSVQTSNLGLFGFAAGIKIYNVAGPPRLRIFPAVLVGVVGSSEFHWRTRILVLSPVTEGRGMLAASSLLGFESEEKTQTRILLLECAWRSTVNKDLHFSDMELLSMVPIADQVSEHNPTELWSRASEASD